MRSDFVRVICVINNLRYTAFGCSGSRLVEAIVISGVQRRFKPGLAPPASPTMGRAFVGNLWPRATVPVFAQYRDITIKVCPRHRH